MLEIAGGILLAGFLFWVFSMVLVMGLSAMFSKKPPAMDESTSTRKPVSDTQRYFPESIPEYTSWMPRLNHVSKEERDAEVEKVHSAPQYAAMKAYMANKKQGHSFSV